MSSKSVDSDACTCKKYCKCELKAKKRLEKERDGDRSHTSSLGSKSAESKKKRDSDDSKKKRGSDDHKRSSEDDRRKSDDHRRGSDDQKRKSSDERHKRKSDLSRDISDISRDQSFVSREQSDISRHKSDESRRKSDKSKRKSSGSSGRRHSSHDGSELSIQGHSISSVHRDSGKSAKKHLTHGSKSSHLSSIYEESERSTEGSHQHYVDSRGEVRSMTSSMMAQKKKLKKRSSDLSLVTFSPSSSEESAPSLRSSYFESAYSMHKDLLKTKEFLQTGTGVTLYDHLAEVVQRVVSNRIGDAVDFIESISKDVKEQRFLSQADKLKDIYKIPKNLCEVKRLNSLYKSLNPPKEVGTIDEIRSSMEYEEKMSEMSGMLSGDVKEPDLIRIPNFIESNNYFRQAGFGLPEWEIFDLTVSVTRLVKNMKNVFSKIRFFGKIFGLHKSYYVLETELTMEEVERCKRIQYEQEQALLAGEKSEPEMEEPISEQMEVIESVEASQEEPLVEISHEELVRRITKKSEKARKEALQRKSDSQKSGASQSQEVGSARMSEEQRRSSAGKSLEGEGSAKTGSASVKTGSGSVKTGSAKTGSASIQGSLETGQSEIVTTSIETYNTEDMMRETEEMAIDIIHGIVRDIMECIAIDMLKSIEEELPILPPEPVNKWTPPREVPQEEIGEGLNRTVFWVCNNLEDEWICLPNVSPKHIDVARKITVGFTGNLDTEIVTYPLFDGKEKDYLRAQLARINSATSVSPMGYFVRGIEGDDDDEDVDLGGSTKYGEGEEYDENYDYEDEGIDIKRNPHYKNRSMSQLGNESLFYWVHHRKEIKKDGRITWWEYDDEDQLEEDMDDDGTETEHTVVTNSSGASSRMPRPLFKPLSREEAWIEESKAGWSVSRQPSYMGGPTIVALRSLRWPGAVAYASVDGKSDYMYIGWGLKLLPNGYRPVELPPFCTEYPTGEDITEDLDPTVTDEEDQLEEGQPPLRPRKISERRSTMEEDEGTYEGSTARNSEMVEEDEDVTDSNAEKSSDSEEEEE